MDKKTGTSVIQTCLSVIQIGPSVMKKWPNMLREKRYPFIITFFQKLEMQPSPCSKYRLLC